MSEKETETQIDEKALEVLQYFAQGFVKAQRVIVTAAGTVELQRATSIDGQRVEEAIAHLHNRLTRLHFLELERATEPKPQPEPAADAARSNNADVKRTAQAPALEKDSKTAKLVARDLAKGGNG